MFEPAVKTAGRGGTLAGGTGNAADVFALRERSRPVINGGSSVRDFSHKCSVCGYKNHFSDRYCVFAFGLPLLLTAVLAVLEFSPIEDHYLLPRMRKRECFLNANYLLRDSIKIIIYLSYQNHLCEWEFDLQWSQEFVQITLQVELRYGPV
ncbi:hypothetical protein EVAR_48152_1 [Eumeta japonica]|uniref:Uncharacterized protein n=1 Tax=Eumeta variegata TaxID=151549 RepID=A0A4C1WRB8_EUMVA|nr:hypothetical protein EVAR_48152_1 [Eumeta japonica]